MSTRVIMIGNPAAGRGKGAAALDTAAGLLRERGMEPRVLCTERPGHARELGSSPEVGAAELLLVFGGDGTVRDVVAGIAAAGHWNVPVGLIPLGTGNDLARTLCLPRSVEPALEVALGGSERYLDVWRWNDEPFLNVAGVGLDAAVAATANRRDPRFRRLRGTLAYLAAFFLTLPSFQPFALSLEGEGGAWTGKAWLAAFANGRCYGGGMQIAPHAEPDDGLLDITLIEDVPKIELLRQLPGLFRGAHIRHPRVRSLRTPRVRIEAPPQAATLDGELIGRVPAVVALEGGKLRVRVSREKGREG